METATKDIKSKDAQQEKRVILVVINASNSYILQ